VADQRGVLGSVMNHLQHTISFTENSIEGHTDSEAAIRDADMAYEVTEFSKARILLQTSNAMLVQSNVNTVQALALL